ncbi:MAG: LLM class flavin-dependent oxidoreductase [Candidatus Dormibacteraeota bacterium]|nr:LLM class flavin-dependent oxidoreductase [Candidatus Dormibacteraeota bacterium]
MHDIGIWVGAYKPRMLRLVGRRADGWLPSLPYLKPGDLARGNSLIDAAAAAAGREPEQIRRLLNVAPVDAPAREAADDLARLALEDGIGTFIVMGDDPRAIQEFASEIAPRVREAVAEARLRVAAGPLAGEGAPPATGAAAVAPSAPAAVDPTETEDERLGLAPTPDDQIRLSQRAAWDESTRPRRSRSGPGVKYTDLGRRVGKHLIEVHDTLRAELSELRDILRQVRDGAMRAADARAALNDMALRQNDWTLGAFCARYCTVVTQHHGLEDASIFPHLARSEPDLTPVIDRLTEEHLVIHEAIQEVDRALVRHMTQPETHDGIQVAIDYLTDTLLSHLAYEEQELVEPLARLGFYPDQVPVRR